VTQPRKQVDWDELQEALDDAGIDRDEFALLVVKAIETAWRSPARHEPSSAFTRAEADALARGGFDLAARRPNEPDIVAQTAARLVVMEAKSATVEEVAKALHVTRARVRQRAAERTLYALRDGDEWRFPRWQFDEQGRPLHGIKEVVPALPLGIHPIAVWRFLSEPSPDLEILDTAVSPLQWLRGGGDPQPVAAIAREL
jgi:excisionase family DNA binding protein